VGVYYYWIEIKKGGSKAPPKVAGTAPYLGSRPFSNFASPTDKGPMEEGRVLQPTVEMVVAAA
jgi:hypothetical protein